MTHKNEVLCNSCGLSCWLGRGPDLGGGNCGLLDAAPMGGYESTPGNGHGALNDMSEYRFSLCEFCLDAMFVDFVIPPLVTEWRKGLTDPVNRDVSEPFIGALDQIIARKSQNWVDMKQITHLETVQRFVRERDLRAAARRGPKRAVKYEFMRVERDVVVGRSTISETRTGRDDPGLPKPQGDGWRHLQTKRYVEWEVSEKDVRMIPCADWRDTSGSLVVCWWYRPQRETA